jgi:hypothetical protein
MSRRRQLESICTRSFAVPPGDSAELEQILLRWDMKLVRKALEQLRADRARAQTMPQKASE